MDKLIDYVKVYKSWAPKEFCENVIKETQLLSWQKHTFYTPHEKDYTDLSGDKEPNSVRGVIPSTDTLNNYVWKAIEQYILKDFKSNYYPGWNGFNLIKFINYKPGELMALHCDHIHDIFDGQIKGIPVLSVIGTLNDNYTGGELVLFKDTVIEMKQGDIVIFPSCFLYPHKVNPVLTGERNSFATWVY